MRGTFSTLLILMFAGSLCFAQQATDPVVTQAALQTRVGVKILIGKVDSITLAGLAKGFSPEIAVVDDKGNKSILLVKPNTFIYYFDYLRKIPLGNLKKDDKVRVKYITTKEGVNEAISIRLLRD